jgi:hypothetical protein
MYVQYVTVEIGVNGTYNSDHAACEPCDFTLLRHDTLSCSPTAAMLYVPDFGVGYPRHIQTFSFAEEFFPGMFFSSISSTS